MIIEAAAPLFAQNGFFGTTTKEIANAASVSEALLYHHFRSKAALYREVQVTVCANLEKTVELISRFPDSTDTLIASLYLFFLDFNIEDKQAKNARNTRNRLLLFSIIENGEIARFVLKKTKKAAIRKFSACIAAGIEAGEIVERIPPSALSTWFFHHLVSMMGSLTLSECHFEEDNILKKERLLNTVRFILRGIGMTDAILEQRVNSPYLQACMKRFELADS